MDGDVTLPADAARPLRPLRQPARADAALRPAPRAPSTRSRYLHRTATRYLSTYAAAAAEGRHGWFRWGVALDTGRAPPRSRSRSSRRCAPRPPRRPGSTCSGGGRCLGVALGRRLSFAVEDTRLVGAADSPRTDAPSPTSSRRPCSSARPGWGPRWGATTCALVKAGRKRFVVGDGFVYDDYGTGIEASFDLGVIGPSWDLGAALFYPTRDFPRAGRRLDLTDAGAAGRLAPLAVRARRRLPGALPRPDRQRGGAVPGQPGRAVGAPAAAAHAGDSAAYRDEERAHRRHAGIGAPERRPPGLARDERQPGARAARTRLDWTGRAVSGEHHHRLAGRRRSSAPAASPDSSRYPQAAGQRPRRPGAGRRPSSSSPATSLPRRRRGSGCRSSTAASSGSRRSSRSPTSSSTAAWRRRSRRARRPHPA